MIVHLNLAKDKYVIHKLLRWDGTVCVFLVPVISAYFLLLQFLCYLNLERVTKNILTDSNGLVDFKNQVPYAESRKVIPNVGLEEEIVLSIANDFTVFSTVVRVWEQM